MYRHLIVICCCFLMSCSTINVNYDYEKATDFSSYKTYNYFSDMQTGMSELDTKRLIDALNVELQNRGFELTDNASFYIDIKSSEYQENQRNTVGIGMGGTGRTMGGGVSIGIPVGQANVNRQIIIDFVDDSKNGLFWQAVSEYSYNPKASPEKREALFKSMVDKVLSAYPPKN